MPRLIEVTRQLYEEGLSGYEIGRIVSEVNDGVIRRVLTFTERDLREAGAGAPPAPFAWLVLGSEGRAQVRAWRSFPRHLAKIAVSHAPSLGFFGRFRLQRADGRRGVNLKLGGMLLLNNALRAYAIDLGLAETNTIERLEAATRARGCFTAAEAEDIREAYETIFHLRLGHQLARLAAGERPDNLLDPARLSHSDQARLREAFRAIRRLQGKVEDRYFTQAL
jgi:signal-transduction protein with cAMP-binding, CBS, and nucleotidyltransferase domain